MKQGWSAAIRNRKARKAWRSSLALYEAKGTGHIRSLEQALEDAYHLGYSEAHEWQMRARVQDAQECREKNGRHL